MKRSVIFLSILLAILTAAITAEYLYSKELKAQAKEIIDRGGDSARSLSDCANDLKEYIEHRKLANRLFYSKDTTDSISNEIAKMIVYADGGNVSDAKAQLESIELLLEKLVC